MKKIHHHSHEVRPTVFATDDDIAKPPKNPNCSRAYISPERRFQADDSPSFECTSECKSYPGTHDRIIEVMAARTRDEIPPLHQELAAQANCSHFFARYAALAHDR